MELTTKPNRRYSMMRQDEPLTELQMREVAPSIFSLAPLLNNCSRPAFIPSCDVLRQLDRYGFSAYMVGQSSWPDAAKREHTRHTVRLRHRKQAIQEDVNEIVLVNSHDGSSVCQLVAGVFRYAGQNAMVCSRTMDEIRIGHDGDVFREVVEGAFRVVDQFPLVDAQKRAMRGLWLTQSDQVAFAKAARSLKYRDADVPPPVTERQLLHIERLADNAADLWTTFNRVHEHLFNDGLPGHCFDGRASTTRGVGSVDEDVNINRAMWALAEAVLELKADPASECGSEAVSQP